MALWITGKFISGWFSFKFHEKRGGENIANEERKQLQNLFGIRPQTKEATVITICSGAGGVGKTSLAVELAAAISKQGYTVCLMDCNYHLGCVMYALQFSEEGPNMAGWACEIAENTQTCMTADAEQSRFQKQFQHIDGTNIYAVLAPPEYAEVPAFDLHALQLMMRAAEQQRAFDYVIYDTISSFDPSTEAAVKHADYVLLVETPELRTVHCNDQLLSYFNKKTGVDFSVIRQLINQIQPEEMTDISREELMHQTPFPCVGQIPYIPETTRARNYGVSMVLQDKEPLSSLMDEMVQKLPPVLKN